MTMISDGSVLNRVHNDDIRWTLNRTPLSTSLSSADNRLDCRASELYLWKQERVALFLSLMFRPVFLLSSLIVLIVASESDSCWEQCESVKRTVLEMSICAEARRHLPRPRVGDFCSRAMETAYHDVCLALCHGTTPKSTMTTHCRPAYSELPKPVIAQFCEHGYNSGYRVSMEKLKNHFSAHETSEL